MEIPFLGVERRFGKSRKTGNNYDICQLLHAWPMASKVTDDYRYTAYGCQQRTIDLSPDALDEFSEIQVGDIIQIRLEPNPDNPERNRVAGLAKK